MRQNKEDSSPPRLSVSDHADPALDLVGALYEFAEHPHKWLEALQALENLPVNIGNETDTVQRLTIHAERAAAVAQTLNKARHDNSASEEKWDAVLISSEKLVRQISGSAAQQLAPLLTKPLQVLQKPEFLPEAKRGLDAAIESAASRRLGGLAHWQAMSSDGTAKHFLLVIARAAFPASLCQSFGLSQFGPEPLFAIAILTQDIASDESRLRESLGLTRAEWRIAQILKSGVSTNQAADQLGITVNTARTQVKSIFSKLGVSRQSELVSRLSLAERVSGKSPTFSRLSQREAPQRQFISLDDGRLLAYRQYGKPNGTPVIAFHQWFSASMLPLPAMDAVEKSGLHMIVFDRPGFGQSTPAKDYTLMGIAQDAIALADHLKFSRFRIWGMASGAAFAIALATRCPSRVEKIALAAPRLRTGVGALPPKGTRAQLSGLMRHPWAIRSFLTMMRSGAGEQIAMSLLRYATARSPSDRRESAKTATARAILQQAFDAHESCTEGLTSELQLFTTLVKPDFSKIQCPVSVWHCEQDPATTYQQVLDEYASSNNVEIHVIRNEGIILSTQSYSRILTWLKA
ncbi:MAG: alpha/beta fold hydrolase [Micropepsaceae bacterium]